MKKHLIATAERPFVESAGRVGRKSHCAHRGAFIQAEQNASRDRGPDGSGGSRRPVQPHEFLIHECSSDARANLVTADGSQNKCVAGHGLAFRQSQQRGKDNHAQMAHGARVHVLAHQSMRERCIGECRIRSGHAMRRSDHRRFTAARRPTR